MKRALVLEGGGAKGAYQAGAIKALNQKKIYFDAAGGTSIGAINAAFYASKRLNAMYKVWLNLESDDFFDIDPKVLDNFHNMKFKFKDIKSGFSSVGKIITNLGIDTSNIKRLLDKHIDEDKFRRTDIEYGMNTFNLSDFKPVYVFKKDIPEGKLNEYILSSAYLPFFKLERIIDNKYYVDGGVYLNCPVDMFIDAGYDEIYVVKAWRSKLKYKNKRNAKVHVITPRENLGSIIRFTKQAARYRMDLGYYDTLRYLYKLDGNKYYFKNYNEKYYSRLFDKDKYKEIKEIYHKHFFDKDDKTFIISMLEKICKEEKIERFKIYDIPFLIGKLKLKMSTKKKNKYYFFIKNIKIEFE